MQRDRGDGVDGADGRHFAPVYGPMSREPTPSNRLRAVVGAAVVRLGDRPGRPATTIASVIDRRGSRPIAAGWHGGHPIPPVLVERRKFTVVAETRGDAGLREILQGLGDDVTRVEL